ncbi:MAG: type II toxin-antitoxin system death-on-curing family toxin [Phycisphaerae bacterium]
MADQPVYLTKQEVLDLHLRVIGHFGGMGGVRDPAALESCLAQPKMAAFGHERFPTIHEKAAAYCFFIVRNHPFFDGNKRTGFLAALRFLRINGITSVYDQDRMYEAIVAVATGELDASGVAKVFREAFAD